ncbi:MAG: DUF1294 domain-containing protein [Lachnospiraceae bacterium]|nr:DUF1294 domain-containing protein [Lachnospiraceae bacterium]
MPSIVCYLLIGYFIIINVVAFAMMGIDKKRARTNAWRISEKTLFLAALLGGSIGAICGMQHFRHKTKHWYFKYGMPAILIAQLVLAAVLIYFLGTAWLRT